MLDKLYHWLKLFCNRQINCKLTTIISYCGMKNEKKMKFYQTNYYSDTFKLIHYLIRIIVQWYDKLNYFIDSFQSVTRNTRPNFFFWYFSLYLRFLSMNSLNSTTKKKKNIAMPWTSLYFLSKLQYFLPIQNNFEICQFENHDMTWCIIQS